MAISLNFIIENEAKRANLEARFWAKVQIGDVNDCWNWIAKARHAFGYGCINAGRGNLYTSHRVAYALHHGGVPDDAYVLHSCDNPACCNPRHLTLGDHAENMKHMKDRGRRLGYVAPPEVREKIKKGRAANPPNMSENARAKLSALMKARWEDPAQVEKMVRSGSRNGNFGKRPPQHVIDAAMANHRSKRGYRHSEETKAKMRTAWRRRATIG